MNHHYVHSPNKRYPCEFNLFKCETIFFRLSQIKRYFVSFWNGVDLRYRLLKGPKIRISIAGIIISRVSTLNLSYCHYYAQFPVDMRVSVCMLC